MKIKTKPEVEKMDRHDFEALKRAQDSMREPLTIINFISQKYQMKPLDKIDNVTLEITRAK